MADGPAWSSSTAYYAGRRDGEWDDSGRGNPAPAIPPVGPVYGTDYSSGSNFPPVGRYGPVYDDPGYNAPGYGVPSYQPADSPNYVAAPAASTGYGATGAPGATSRSAARALQRQATRQRGLPGWAALLILLAIAGVGGIIDISSGNSVRGGFNIALVIASLTAIVIVRHRDMFPIVVAPPLVYIVTSGVLLYVRSGGLHNRHVLIDTAANGLVYGFPAIAGASAAALIVAGIRLVTNK